LSAPFLRGGGEPATVKLNALGFARSERAGDHAGNLGADEVEARCLERVHQQAEIADQSIERPGIVTRHRCRLAESAPA
jgi:hypothetical protein